MYLKPFSLDGVLTIESTCDMQMLVDPSILLKTAFIVGGIPYPNLAAVVLYSEPQAIVERGLGFVNITV